MREVLVTVSSPRGAGTLAWTAPEQALGTIPKADEACNVYSFGILCYEASLNTEPKHPVCIDDLISSDRRCLLAALE